MLGRLYKQSQAARAEARSGPVVPFEAALSDPDIQAALRANGYDQPLENWRVLIEGPWERGELNDFYLATKQIGKQARKTREQPDFSRRNIEATAKSMAEARSGDDARVSEPAEAPAEAPAGAGPTPPGTEGTAATPAGVGEGGGGSGGGVGVGGTEGVPTDGEGGGKGGGKGGGQAAAPDFLDQLKEFFSSERGAQILGAIGAAIGIPNLGQILGVEGAAAPAGPAAPGSGEVVRPEKRKRTISPEQVKELQQKADAWQGPVAARTGLKEKQLGETADRYAAGIGKAMETGKIPAYLAPSVAGYQKVPRAANAMDSQGRYYYMDEDSGAVMRYDPSARERGEKSNWVLDKSMSRFVDWDDPETPEKEGRADRVKAYQDYYASKDLNSSRYRKLYEQNPEEAEAWLKRRSDRHLKDAQKAVRREAFGAAFRGRGIRQIDNKALMGAAGAVYRAQKGDPKNGIRAGQFVHEGPDGKLTGLRVPSWRLGDERAREDAMKQHELAIAQENRAEQQRKLEAKPTWESAKKPYRQIIALMDSTGAKNLEQLERLRNEGWHNFKRPTNEQELERWRRDTSRLPSDVQRALKDPATRRHLEARLKVRDEIAKLAPGTAYDERAMVARAEAEMYRDEQRRGIEGAPPPILAQPESEPPAAEQPQVKEAPAGQPEAKDSEGFDILAAGRKLLGQEQVRGAGLSAASPALGGLYGAYRQVRDAANMSPGERQALKEHDAVQRGEAPDPATGRWVAQEGERKGKWETSSERQARLDERQAPQARQARGREPEARYRSMPGTDDPRQTLQDSAGGPEDTASNTRPTALPPMFEGITTHNWDPKTRSWRAYRLSKQLDRKVRVLQGTVYTAESQAERAQAQAQIDQALASVQPVAVFNKDGQEWLPGPGASSMQRAQYHEYRKLELERRRKGGEPRGRYDQLPTADWERIKRLAAEEWNLAVDMRNKGLDPNDPQQVRAEKLRRMNQNFLREERIKQLRIANGLDPVTGKPQQPQQASGAGQPPRQSELPEATTGAPHGKLLEPPTSVPASAAPAGGQTPVPQRTPVTKKPRSPVATTPTTALSSKKLAPGSVGKLGAMGRAACEPVPTLGKLAFGTFKVPGRSRHTFSRGIPGRPKLTPKRLADRQKSQQKMRDYQVATGAKPVGQLGGQPWDPVRQSQQTYRMGGLSAPVEARAETKNYVQNPGGAMSGGLGRAYTMGPERNAGGGRTLGLRRGRKTGLGFGGRRI